jgi:predicted PP-loop superfamily ATPase
LLLRLQQFREILKHQNISQSLAIMLKHGYGNRDIDRRALNRQFHWCRRCAQAIGPAEQRFQVV